MGKGANTVVSLLHHFPEHHGLEINSGPKQVFVHTYMYILVPYYLSKAHHKQRQCTCTHMNTLNERYIVHTRGTILLYMYIAGAVVIRNVK